MTERVQSLESLASLLGADTALPYRDVVGTASNVLRSHDLHSGNTLMGISWDSSQQNKAITELQASWGDAFYFSGPAGIPTCGSTVRRRPAPVADLLSPACAPRRTHRACAGIRRVRSSCSR